MYIYVYMCIYMCIYIHTYHNVYTHTYIYIYIYMCVCVCVCMYIYIHAHTMYVCVQRWAYLRGVITQAQPARSIRLRRFWTGSTRQPRCTSESCRETPKGENIKATVVNDSKAIPKCSSEWFQIHPQMYYLPQAEGVLLRDFDDRSRMRG